MDSHVDVLRPGLLGGGELGVYTVLNSPKSIPGRLMGSFLLHQIDVLGSLVLNKKSFLPILTLVFSPSSFLILYASSSTALYLPYICFIQWVFLIHYFPGIGEVGVHLLFTTKLHIKDIPIFLGRRKISDNTKLLYYRR